jgi:predicted aconitase with swiveling domain
MAADRVLRAGRAYGGRIEGEALVSDDAFSPRYDLDRGTGVVTRRGHSLEGASIAGRVLVCPTAKGGVAGGWAFVDLASRGLAPSAMLFDVANPVMVQGAVAAEIPILDGFEVSVVEALRTGDHVVVDPPSRTVRVRRC